MDVARAGRREGDPEIKKLLATVAKAARSAEEAQRTGSATAVSVGALVADFRQFRDEVRDEFGRAAEQRQETNNHLAQLNGRTARSETAVDVIFGLLRALDARVSEMADQFTWFRGLTSPIRLAWAVSRHKALTAAILVGTGMLGGGLVGSTIAAGMALLGVKVP